MLWVEGNVTKRGKTLLLVCATWIGIGFLHGALRQVVMGSAMEGQRHIILFLIIFDLIWIPATLVAVWAVRRFPVTESSKRNAIIANTLIAIAVSLVCCVWHTWLRRTVYPHAKPTPFWLLYVANCDGWGSIYAAIAASLYAVQAYRAFFARELRNATLGSELAEAELASLSMQLQPHFLFNTLQTIAELLRRTPAAAKKTLLDLRSLLALSIRTSPRALVPLSDELLFIGSYLDIQKARFGDSLSSRIECPPALAAALIPHMVLQPLVENAIKHGTARAKGSGMLGISFSREGERLIISIRDNGPGVKPAAAHGGIGISNTSRRLEHLYGRDFELQLRSDDSGTGAVAILDIPAFRTAAETVSIPLRARATARSGSSPRPEAVSPHSEALLSLVAPREPAPRLSPLPWMAIVLAWLGVGLYSSAQQMVSWQMTKMSGTWSSALLINMPNAALLGLLTPLVFVAARRIALRRLTLAKTASLLVVLGVMFSVVELVLLAVVVKLTRNVYLTPTNSPLVALFVWNFCLYVVMVGATYLKDLGALHGSSELRAASLEKAVALTRLDLFKLQLQPSFLAMTLRTLANLAESNTEECLRLLHTMSHLMRGLLQGIGSRVVTVSDEVIVASDFLALEKQNFAGHLAVEVNVADAVQNALVPNLVLQPLITRVLRPHSASVPGKAKLTITIDGDATTLRVQLACQRFAPIGVSNSAEESKMAYVEARLSQLFGPMFSLEVEDENETSSHLTLVLPARFDSRVMANHSALAS